LREIPPDHLCQIPRPLLFEDSTQVMEPAIEHNHTPRLTMECASPSTDTAYSYLPTPDGSVEGLGIVCTPAAISLQHDSAIDAAYDNSAWQAQIDDQILQFQQAYEQKLHQNRHLQLPFGAFDSSQACSTEHMKRAVDVGNDAIHQIYETASAEINDTKTTSIIGFNPCLPTQQNFEPFPNYPMAVEHDDDLVQSFQPFHSGLQVASPYFPVQAADQRDSSGTAFMDVCSRL